MTQPNLSPRQVRWQEYLSRFSFEWIYTPGKTNPADALSRRADFKTLSVITTRSRTGSLPKQTEDPVSNAPGTTKRTTRRKRKTKGTKSKAKQTLTKAAAPTADDPIDLLAKIKAGYKLDTDFAKPAYTSKWTFSDGLWYRQPPATATDTDSAQIVVPACSSSSTQTDPIRTS
jgi:hypothetical protein